VINSHVGFNNSQTNDVRGIIGQDNDNEFLQLDEGQDDDSPVLDTTLSHRLVISQCSVRKHESLGSRWHAALYFHYDFEV
jgi:hypothetical protein